jgi:BirA family biotin operon repressor/biotin-[acetyl-CoA-carboxylase] ligase
MGPPVDIAEALLGTAERLGPMEGRLTWHPAVTSTNTVALGLAEHGADEGSVVAAGMQTAGRGRHGRLWASPEGAGIYASVVLRPSLRVVPLLTIAAGVAVAEGVVAATGLQATLKWPNDLYAGGRKLGGILAEGGTTHVVLGFGINVLSATLPPDVAAHATSIERELGRPVDRGLVLAESLAAIWRRYQDLEEHRVADVLDAWRTRAAAMMGRPIEWDREGVTESGHAAGIDEAGALLMKTASSTLRIVSGEVRWV